MKLISLHFISFIDSAREAKGSQKSEHNRCTRLEPNGEKTRKKVSVGGKPQRIIPGKKYAARGTEKPIHIVPQVGFEPGSQRLKDESRHHYANFIHPVTSPLTCFSNNSCHI